MKCINTPNEVPVRYCVADTWQCASLGIGGLYGIHLACHQSSAASWSNPSFCRTRDGTKKARSHWPSWPVTGIWCSDMAQAIAKAFEPIWLWAARRYQAAVANKLKKYGLRYDDLRDPDYDIDVKEAMDRLPQLELDLRNQRIKRAMDTDMKHTYLPEDLQAKQTPFAFYLRDHLKQVKAERKEREMLGYEVPYDRSLP